MLARDDDDYLQHDARGDRSIQYTLVLFAVMDVTDIINGKVDDEDKQHFIPFQP